MTPQKETKREPRKYFCSNCITYLTKLEAMETHDQSHDIVCVLPNVKELSHER